MVRSRLLVPLTGGLASLLCATALVPLFKGLAWWLGPSTLAVVVVVVAGTLCRWLRAPAAAHVAAYVVGLLVTATVACAGGTALLGVIPTGATFGTIRALIDEGGADIRGLSVPVPSRPGLVLFTVVGVYVVAALVDVIAATLRRPSLAGLPLLGLFAVPAAVVPAGVGLLPFTLGGLGYVGLLLVESTDLVSGWGAALGAAPGAAEHEGRPAPRSTMGAAGRRIGVAALAGALILPGLLPDIGHGLLGTHDSGSRTRGVVDPMASLTQRLHSTDTVDYLRVRVTGQPTYLRLLALDSFTAAGFVAPTGAIHGTSDDRVPGALDRSPVGPTRAVSEDIGVYPALAEPYLPVPYNPTGITGLQGDWRLAAAPATIFSSSADTSGAGYTVRAQVPAPSAADLATGSYPVPARYAQDTRLPGNLDPRIRTLAEQITRTARTPQQKVTAIQNYLRSSTFVYDLTGAPTVTATALSTFLFTTHRGYCEQFASAMTVLVRALGLPARVAIGFTQGTLQTDGTWLITNRDAHAWPEVWFPGNGWLQFEPTPSGATTTVVPAYAPGPAASGGTAEQPLDKGVQKGQAPASPAPLPPRTGGTDTTAAPATGRHGAGGGFPVLPVAIAAAVVLVALLAPAAVRLRRRRRRLGAAVGPGSPGARTEAVWRELLDLTADLGFPAPASESPRATAARLARRLPTDGAGRPALRRLATAEEGSRYAPPDAPSPATGALRRDVRAVARELRQTVDNRRRVQAVVAPPSVTREIRSAARSRRRRAAGTAERLGTTAGRRLRRRRVDH